MKFKTKAILFGTYVACGTVIGYYGYAAHIRHQSTSSMLFETIMKLSRKDKETDPEKAGSLTV